MLQTTVLSEAAAIEAAKKGCSLGQTYLYNKHKAKMVAKYTPKIGRDIAQDIVQNAFVSVFKAIQIEGKYDICNFAAVLNTATYNEFVNHYRKDKRNEPIETADYEGISSENGEFDFYKIELIEKAITMLNSSEKSAIKMLVEGYKYEDMAEMLKMPIGTVKNAIHTARKKLEYLK